MNLTWRQRGACRGLDPDIFYPLEDADAGPAKAVCTGCSVRDTCLEFALDTREGEGIWGGTTARERRRLLRQRRKTAAA